MVYSFHSFCLYVCICVNIFSQGTTAPKLLKFGTNIGHDLLYCGKGNNATYV